MNILGIIPARMGSSRYPGKPMEKLPINIFKLGDKFGINGYNEVKKWQGQVHIVNYTKGKSSTGILEKLI